MPRCTVTRTHRLGEKLHPRDWPTPIPGPVYFQVAQHPALNRSVPQLVVHRTAANQVGQIPPLCDPQILTLASDQGMMIAGFEEIDSRRYYQGWYIRWVDDDVRTDPAGTKLE